MTDANGNYTLVVPTNGQPLDGYVKGTLATYLDTYLYPPAVVVTDFAGASLNMVTQETLDLLANLLCNADQTPVNGLVAAIVIDAAEAPVLGATVSSNPAGNKVCYNDTDNGLPNRNATATADDGLAYVFNVTGQITVSASKAGASFTSHSVNARAGTFTTTLIQP
jgi:hypothetical protein